MELVDVVKFNCPGCRKRYSAPRSRIGRAVRCKRCGCGLRVPAVTCAPMRKASVRPEQRPTAPTCARTANGASPGALRVVTAAAATEVPAGPPAATAFPGRRAAAAATAAAPPSAPLSCARRKAHREAEVAGVLADGEGRPLGRRLGGLLLVLAFLPIARWRGLTGDGFVFWWSAAQWPAAVVFGACPVMAGLLALWSAGRPAGLPMGIGLLCAGLFVPVALGSLAWAGGAALAVPAILGPTLLAALAATVAAARVSLARGPSGPLRAWLAGPAALAALVSCAPALGLAASFRTAASDGPDLWMARALALATWGICAAAFAGSHGGRQARIAHKAVLYLAVLWLGVFGGFAVLALGDTLGHLLPVVNHIWRYLASLGLILAGMCCLLEVAHDCRTSCSGARW